MNRTYCSLLVGAAVIGAGCSGSTQPQGGTATATAAGSGDALLAKLRAADLVDGTEDHVIGKCYVCGLGMDGDPEHAADHQGYTAHFCSEHCRGEFVANPKAVIAATAVPQTAL